MLVQNDLPVMFQPLKNLLGAFLNEDGSRGVIITTERPLSVQRFTAAHELGHAMLGHEPSIDPAGIMFRYPVADRTTADYSLEEIQANVFASQLLIPRWLVAMQMKRQGWASVDMSNSDIVYQLSLRLGVSYRAVCHALLRHQIIKSTKCDALINVEPRAIKVRLADAYNPEDWRRDVWVITGRDDGILLEGSRSDLVVFKVKEHSGSGYLWRLEELADAGFAVVNDGLEDADEETFGGVVIRKVTARPKSKDGVDSHVVLREARPWQMEVKPLQSLQLDVDFVGPVNAGLHRAQRAALLGIA
jgi:Zn-dependent peptidase ImmA (M78 family)